MRPDYAGGSLLNLMASIVDACGGRPLHAPLRNFQAGKAENLVLLIIDGLGDNYLQRHGAGSELARRRRAPITSVFPSTTASAITTSYTGAAPLEHGLTGWFTYFGEAGYVAAPLPFRTRGEYIPLRDKGYSPERAFPAPALFESLPVRSIVVTHKDIIDSDYNLRHCKGAERRAYETLNGLVLEIEKAVKSGAGRKFVYAYWPEYDALSHRYGSQSPESQAEFQRIDAAFGEILQRLAGTDSRVIATADHGFIDVAPAESLDLPPELAGLLRFPLCGERRVAYCHVHDPSGFLQKSKDWLREKAEVRFSRELVDEGWFGPGQPHPRFAERIGDVTLVMRERYTVKDWTPGEPRHLHIGNHGGTSEDEMKIPLIMEAV
ncbi:MAG TPA: alkaline phosphatase family protein [Burkholderiales bacterium]